MRVYRHDTLTARRAPESTFTGEVTVGNYRKQDRPSRLVTATVGFPPGARTPWTVNPLGQTLVVLSGTGWAQGTEGVVEIRTGDIVSFAPGERHWEGATPDDALTCLAVQEEEPGLGVQFGAEVTDAEYRAGARGA